MKEPKLAPEATGERAWEVPVVLLVKTYGKSHQLRQTIDKMIHDLQVLGYELSLGELEIDAIDPH